MRQFRLIKYGKEMHNLNGEESCSGRDMPRQRSKGVVTGWLFPVSMTLLADQWHGRGWGECRGGRVGNTVIN